MTPEPPRARTRTAAAIAPDRLVYLLLALGTLVAFAYRATVIGQISWDGMALTNACCFLATNGQSARRVLSRGWPAAALTTLLVADLLSLLMR